MEFATETIQMHPNPKSLALEHVKVSNSMDDDEEHKQNSTASQTKAIVGDLDVLCGKNCGTNFLSAHSNCCFCCTLLFLSSFFYFLVFLSYLTGSGKIMPLMFNESF